MKQIYLLELRYANIDDTASVVKAPFTTRNRAIEHMKNETAKYGNWWWALKTFPVNDTTFTEEYFDINGESIDEEPLYDNILDPSKFTTFKHWIKNLF